MRTVRLSGTEIVTTPLGFGCAGLSRLPWSAQRREVIEAAYESGIRHFDVAPMYGLGAAESELAPVLKRRRDQITITTKFGIDATAFSRVAARLQGPVRLLLSKRPNLEADLKVVARGPRSGWVGRLLYASAGYSEQSAERSLAHSLSALGTEYIDVFALHDPVGGLISGAPGLIRYLNGQRDLGRIRTWGIAGEKSDLPDVVERLGDDVPLAQFQDDLFDLAPHAGPVLAKAKITFGALRRVLPAIQWFLARSPTECDAWSARFELDVRNETSLPLLLLRQANRRNPDGIVLFSSSRKTRVRAAGEALTDTAMISRVDEGVAISELAAAARSASRESGRTL